MPTCNHFSKSFSLHYITLIRDNGTNLPMMTVAHLLNAVDSVITAYFG